MNKFPGHKSIKELEVLVTVTRIVCAVHIRSLILMSTQSSDVLSWNRNVPNVCYVFLTKL